MKNNKKWRLPIIILSVFCLTALIILVKAGLTNSINDEILHWFMAERTASRTLFMQIITHLGDWYAYTALCIALILPKKTRNFGISLGLLLLFSDGVKTGLKEVLRVPRPLLSQLVHASGYGFPSGHTMAATACAFWCIRSLLKTEKHKKWQILLTVLCLLMAALIATSRVYLGVHNPTDILGGLLAITATFLIYIGLHEKYLKKRLEHH